jgi:hypothetical protein
VELQFAVLETNCREVVDFVRGQAPVFTPEDLQEEDLESGATDIVAVLRFREKVFIR